MCLVVVGWRAHPRYRLIVAANRDEFHARPAAPLGWWPDDPQVLAGRDLEARGTWMGLSRSGHFCALTNFREPGARPPDTPSRGRLVADYLMRPSSPEDYLQELSASAARYAGFNLLVGGPDSLYYLSNRDDRVPRRLPEGVHGLSNHRLGTPWAKVRHAEQGLGKLLAAPRIATTALLELLADRRVADDPELAEGGLPPEWERLLSAVFVRHPEYGTRCSTAVLVEHDGLATVHERRFDASGCESGSTRIEFMIGQAVAATPGPDRGVGDSSHHAGAHDDWPE